MYPIVVHVVCEDEESHRKLDIFVINENLKMHVEFSQSKYSFDIQQKQLEQIEETKRISYMKQYIQEYESRK